MIPAGWDRWLLMASAALPALGAALEGINNQGEFTRTARRAPRWRAPSKPMPPKSQAREETRPSPGPATALSSQITQTMVDEVTDWRAVFSDRAQ